MDVPVQDEPEMGSPIIKNEETGGENEMSETRLFPGNENCSPCPPRPCPPCPCPPCPCPPCPPCDGGLAGLEICEGVDRTATDCCAEVIPSGIALQSGEGTRRIIFDIRELRCEVVRCLLVQGNVVIGPRFAVRIVGCLPYIASVAVRSDAVGVCTEPGNSFANVCCNESASIDNVIALFEDVEDAEACCQQALTCGNVRGEIGTPTISSPINACGDRLLTFAVTFTFQGCQVAG